MRLTEETVFKKAVDLLPRGAELDSAYQSSVEGEWDGAFVSLIDAAIDSGSCSQELLDLIRAGDISPFLRQLLEQVEKEQDLNVTTPR